MKKHEIVAYITYLYQVRNNGKEIPSEIIASWENIQEDDIDFHLNEMYKHWGINESEIKQYEYNFKQIDKVEDIIDNQETNNAPKVKKKNGLNIFAVLIGIIILSTSTVFFIKSRDKNPQIKANAKIEEPIAIVETAASAPVIQKVSEEDRINGEVINKWLQLESEKNIASLFYIFVPNMIEFYGISYPTEEEIYEYYFDLNSSMPNYTNKILNIKNLGNLSYEVKFKRYNDKISKNQTVKVSFNEEHGITKIK